MGLSVSTNWKGNTNDSTLAIVDWLTKIGHYLSVKVNIDVLSLTEVILNVII